MKAPLCRSGLPLRETHGADRAAWTPANEAPDNDTTPATRGMMRERHRARPPISGSTPFPLLLLLLVLLGVGLIAAGCSAGGKKGSADTAGDRSTASSSVRPSEPADPEGTDRAASGEEVPGEDRVPKRTEGDDPQLGAEADSSAGETGGLPYALALTAADNGGSLSIRRGGEITVALPANPSTGYMWELELDDPEASLLEQLAEPFFKSDKPDAPGVDGVMIFHFLAADAGEMSLRMVYLPPGRGETSEVFEITLTVI